MCQFFSDRCKREIGNRRLGRGQLLCRVATAKTVSNCVCSFPSRYNRIYTRTSPLLPSFVSRGSCLPKCRQLFRTGDISFAFCPVIAPKAGKALLSSHHICDKVRTDPANETALIFFRSLRFFSICSGILIPTFWEPILARCPTRSPAHFVIRIPADRSW